MNDGGNDARTNPLPREIASGVFWLGECLAVHFQGRELHGYNSSYVVVGDECSMIVETGHPRDLPIVESQLDSLLAAGIPELRYIFTTHTETPHSAGTGRLLDRFPEAIACGDVSDLHLVFPQFESRLRQLTPGDSLDLGGRQFQVLEAVFRDYLFTLWGFDAQERVLFSGDGFSYVHYHADGHCGMLAEEAESLDLPDMTALFAEIAFYWTRFADIEPYVARLDELLIDELGVKVIAPTHGLPIGDLPRTLPRLHEGLRAGSAASSLGLRL